MKATKTVLYRDITPTKKAGSLVYNIKVGTNDTTDITPAYNKQNDVHRYQYPTTVTPAYTIAPHP